MRFPIVIVILTVFFFSIFFTESKIFQVTDRRATAKQEAAFTAFINKYGKKYSSRKEYSYRLTVFVKNTLKAAQNQILDPTAVHGTTPFSDLTTEEFERSFTGLLTRNNIMNSEESMMETKGLPENFDWREKGAVTGVKTQV